MELRRSKEDNVILKKDVSILPAIALTWIICGLRMELLSKMLNTDNAFIQACHFCFEMYLKYTLGFYNQIILRIVVIYDIEAERVLICKHA